MGVGVCLFCSGIGIAFCIVYRYKAKKREIMRGLKPGAGAELGSLNSVSDLGMGDDNNDLDFYGN